MPCLRTLARAALPLAALAAALPLHAADKPVLSWGKAGVSYEAYLRDSIECGLRGYYLDVAATRQAQTLREASRRLESLDGTAPSGDATGGVDPVTGAVNHARQLEQVRAAARPDRQIRELRELMQAEVGKCLAERGYRRFALDPAQQERLGGLKPGTDERRLYLHSLASDSSVIERQAASAG